MDATVSRSGADAFGCPVCGRRVELHGFVEDPELPEVRCGLQEPLLAVCVQCQAAYTLDGWHDAKGIGPGTVQEGF